MRALVKYKIFSKRIPDVAPSRLLKFKSSKWLKNRSFMLRILKKQFSKVKRIKLLEKAKRKRLTKYEQKYLEKYEEQVKRVGKIKPKLKSKYGIILSVKKMPRIKKHFKTCLQANVTLKQFFGYRSKFSLANIKEKNFDLIYKAVFLKQFFKIEILLWKLNFFKSTEEAVQNLLHGKILVNGLKKSPNYFLKKGDIITFVMPMSNVSFLNKDVLNSKAFLRRSIYPFVEIDFFTKTIVILKDEQEMSLKDIFLFTPFLLNIRHLQN
jgi:ribosomal protein S4